MESSFVTVGYVDERQECHEMQVTRDCIPAATERGWLVLDEAVLGLPVRVSKPDATGYSGPEDDDDDGA